MRIGPTEKVLWFGNGSVMCETHGLEFEAVEKTEEQPEPEPVQMNRKARRSSRVIPT